MTLLARGLYNMTAMSYFRSAIWQRKSIFIEAVLLTIVINMLGLGTSLYAMQVYDRVIPNQAMETLLVLTVGVLLAMGFNALLSYTRMLMVEKACKAIDTELSDVFFQRALNIRMDQRPTTVGTFAAQIRMFETVRQFLTSTTLFLLADVPFALIFIGVIWMLAGSLALLPLMLLVVTLIVGFMFIKPVARLSMMNAEESNVKNGLLIESIDGIESIKAFKAQQSFVQRWHNLTNLIGQNDLALKKWSGLSTNFSQLIQQISYVGLVAFGVYQITEGELTMGALIAVTIISGRALSPLAQTAHVVVQWQQSKAALAGLDQLMQHPIDGQLDDGLPLVHPDHAIGKVDLSQVVFGYDNIYNALSIGKLSIEPGQHIAIVGGIGSGKSTLLKLISGLYLPTEGRVFFDQVDTAHLAPDFLRQHIYYLPQSSSLFNGTLKDNLLMGLEQLAISDSDILTAAQTTGLIELIQRHPRGLGLIIQEGGKGLSGGQKQLVALTQLMIRMQKQPPKLLLLDEPTSALDGKTEASLMLAISTLMREAKASLIFVTHKPSQLSFADRVLVMDQGRIIADDKREVIAAKLTGAKTA
jgi:ATP-binding cassette subfamily C protein LapB